MEECIVTTARLRLACAVLGILLMLGASGYYYRSVSLHGRAVTVLQLYMAGRYANPSDSSQTKMLDAKLAMDKDRLLSTSAGVAGAALLAGAVFLGRDWQK